MDQIPNGAGALEKFLYAIGGFVGAALTYLGLRSTNKATLDAKKVEQEAASSSHFIAFGEKLIDEQADRVAALEEQVKGHTEQILALYRELYEAKSTITSLRRDVEVLTTANTELRAQNVKLVEDNKNLREINRELMSQVRSDMQTSSGLREMVADSEEKGKRS